MPLTTLWRLAFSSAVIVVLTHVLRIFTMWGQRWDDDAYLEATRLDPALRDACDALLSGIRIPSIAVVLIACLAVSVVRRQVITGAVVITAFVGAVLTAEVSASLLPRPDLAPDLTAQVNNAGANTFPSGHAAIAAGLALAVITVAAPRWRTWVGVAGLAFTIAVCGSTVIAGWHRPSDAIAGIALSVMWMSLASLLLCRLRGAPVDTPSPSGALIAGGGIAGAAILVVVALSITGAGLLLAFATSLMLIIVAACVLISAYSSVLGRVDFSR